MVDIVLKNLKLNIIEKISHEFKVNSIVDKDNNITIISTEGNDIKIIDERLYGFYLFRDRTSLPFITLNVQEVNCDFLTFMTLSEEYKVLVSYFYPRTEKLFYDCERVVRCIDNACKSTIFSLQDGIRNSLLSEPTKVEFDNNFENMCNKVTVSFNITWSRLI